MKRTSLLPLIFLSVFCPFSVDSGEFEFVEEQMKYEDARSYCREKDSDLVTIHNSTEMDELHIKYSNKNATAWIGLEFGGDWILHWSRPDHNSNYSNWSEELQMTSEEVCVSMNENGTWFENDCETQLSFVCYNSSDTRNYTFVEEPKTWRDAESHCWNFSSYLVSIQSEEESRAIVSLAAFQNVWIGLFIDRWKWSDGSNSPFRSWGTGQPQNLTSKKCVAARFDRDDMWDNRNCNNPNKFICYAQKPTPATTSSQTMLASLTTDQLLTNMTTILQNSSQGFTAAGLNTTNVTTTASTTSSGLTVANTTKFVSRPSSTELDNTGTEMTVTPTQQHPTPTVNVSTSSASTLTTQGTSAQTTATSTSHSLQPENLILIQKNMTWTEALGYCRERYLDFVHITSKDIQDKVAQKAKGATSPYVWLGLRYSCNFKFWFWAGSTSGCYQNWIPGQGPERVYECGFSGAIEATGRQQWTGLPETEELNFICITCAG